MASVTNPLRTCDQCHISEQQTPTGKLLTCGKCRSVKYCSSDCQKTAWPSHKQFCKIPSWLRKLGEQEKSSDPAEAAKTHSINNLQSAISRLDEASLNASPQKATALFNRTVKKLKEAVQMRPDSEEKRIFDLSFRAQQTRDPALFIQASLARRRLYCSGLEEMIGDPIPEQSVQQDISTLAQIKTRLDNVESLEQDLFNLGRMMEKFQKLLSEQ